MWFFPGSKAFGPVPGLLLAALLLAVPARRLPARGPLYLERDEAVTIYRDFDNGGFGRSEYRGVVFSIKLESFRRYRSLAPRGGSALTGLLLSPENTELLSGALPEGLTRARPVPAGETGVEREQRSPREAWIYRLDKDGIQVEFSLERAPEEIFDEIRNTYRDDAATEALVAESYRQGYILRIWLAENVYRPEFAFVDYEDVLVSATLLADPFQPLWGIHDGNNFLSFSQ